MINGYGFGEQTGSARVQLLFKPVQDGNPAECIPACRIISWSDAEIICEVPVDNKGCSRSACRGPRPLSMRTASRASR
jgi:hypothetical protein